MTSKQDHDPKAGAAQAPGFTLPGVGGMFEAMDLARQAWTSYATPAGLPPALDPAELERRLGDLRAVEQWLSMNLNLLRATIQSMEIQQASLLAMQTLGQSMAPDAAAGRSGAALGKEAAAAGVDPAAMWQQLQEQFQRVALAALAAGSPGSAPDAGKSAASAPQRPKRARAARKPAGK